MALVQKLNQSQHGINRGTSFGFNPKPLRPKTYTLYSPSNELYEGFFKVIREKFLKIPGVPVLLHHYDVADLQNGVLPKPEPYFFRKSRFKRDSDSASLVVEFGLTRSKTTWEEFITCNFGNPYLSTRVGISNNDLGLMLYQHYGEGPEDAEDDYGCQIIFTDRLRV